MFRQSLSRLLMVLGITAAATAAPAAEPVRIIATVPDLGSIAEAIGGDRVRVKVLAKPTEDPHFVDPRPTFVRAMNQADMYLQVGMELESGWAPVLLENARNSDVLPGGPGYVDASEAVIPLQVPTTTVDRSMGDVHPLGNPHYMADPVQGLRVARLVRDRLFELRPAERAYFDNRYRDFADRLARALVGPTLADRYGIEGVEKLARLQERGKLAGFLESQGELSALGGWLGTLLPHYGTKAVDDHNMWPYFARRFGIDIVGHLEPKPGIPPTTKHLRALIERMQAERIGVILTSVYYDPRHARFVSENTGARVVAMAHQAGARPGTEDYLAMVDYNVRQLASALGADT